MVKNRGNWEEMKIRERREESEDKIRDGRKMRIKERWEGNENKREIGTK